MIILFFVWFLTGLDLARKLIRAEIQTAGALGGVILGVLLGFVALRRSYRLAQKGVFVDKMTGRERRIMFFIIWPLFGVGAICLIFVKYIYLPDLDLSKVVGTGLAVFLFVFSLVGIAGIGSGKPQLAHKPDEYIDIADVEKAVEYYKNIILKFLT